jgi:arylsulfatase A-like enzyme
VILILIDTLRRDHLSGEGYPRPTSPALDELAARGARFRAFRSQSSYTKPSVASLLTSLYPSGHRIGHLRTVLADANVTLAEAFHAGGYRTAKFVSNPIIGPEFGFAQGTEVFHMRRTHLIPKTKLGYALFRLNSEGREIAGFRELRDLLRSVERSLHRELQPGALELSASGIVQAFRDWRGSIQEAPYFAYLHFMEPHAPYVPPEDLARKFADPGEPMSANYPPSPGLFLPFQQASPLPENERRGLVRAYDAEIAGIDRALGEFFASLPEAELERTIVAVTSDHGEEFYEHAGWSHGHSLYEELLGVPLLIAGPGVRHGLELDGAAEHIDVGPTLLELAGVEVPSAMIGRSLAASLRGDLELQGASSAGTETPRGQLAELVYGDAYWARSLREDRWKLIVSRLGSDERVELFDLGTDRGETRNLAAEHPELQAAMRSRMEVLVRSSLDGAPEEVTTRLDPGVEAQLRALGYAQ